MSIRESGSYTNFYTRPVRALKRNVANIALATSVLLMMAEGCTVKGRMQYFNNTIDLGNIPSDVCMVNGIPQVLNISTETEGGVNLVYIENNGDVVAQHYIQDARKLGQGYTEAGRFVIHGGLCPSTKP